MTVMMLNHHDRQKKTKRMLFLCSSMVIMFFEIHFERGSKARRKCSERKRGKKIAYKSLFKELIPNW